MANLLGFGGLLNPCATNLSSCVSDQNGEPQIGPGQAGIPPDPLACSTYLDGTGAGSALYHLCMAFPDGQWSNCVRDKLLNQYVANGNPLDLAIYLVWDHPKDFATCAIQ